MDRWRCAVVIWLWHKFFRLWGKLCAMRWVRLQVVRKLPPVLVLLGDRWHLSYAFHWPHHTGLSAMGSWKSDALFLLSLGTKSFFWDLKRWGVVTLWPYTAHRGPSWPGGSFPVATQHWGDLNTPQHHSDAHNKTQQCRTRAQQRTRNTATCLV